MSSSNLSSFLNMCITVSQLEITRSPILEKVYVSLNTSETDTIVFSLPSDALLPALNFTFSKQ